MYVSGSVVDGTGALWLDCDNAQILQAVHEGKQLTSQIDRQGGRHSLQWKLHLMDLIKGG
jgi:hypothetical protein